MYRQDLDLFKKHFHRNCLLHVGMGSSETGMMLECFFDHDSECLTPTLPAGYPAQDVEVLLLDESGRVIEGEGTGEIAVRGRHLARGYWGRPELTDQRFLPDPTGSGVRTYHTGDLGYRSLDGCMTHRGRTDSQVKIRGYRVDLSEIELAILAIPGIKEAVVVARENHTGEQQLVTYVVSTAAPGPSARSLLGPLRQKLPDFMMPSAFVVLEALPLLPNGKVDRRALPPPDWERSKLARTLLPPRGPIEEKLVEIWTNVLGLEHVGVQDEFLELGGHSLLATRLLSEVTSVFGIQLSLRTLFDNPTIQGMALAITQSLTERMERTDLKNLLEQTQRLSNDHALSVSADPESPSDGLSASQKDVSPSGMNIQGRVPNMKTQ